MRSFMIGLCNKEIEESNKRDLVNTISQLLSGRINMRYNKCDALKNIFYQIPFCKRKSTQMHSLMNRKLNLIDKGKKKLLDELDCVHVVEKLRAIEVMSDIFLKKNQKQLLKYQKKYLLQEVSSSEDD